MRCKLCQNDKKLLRRSHIISDFLYRDLFDDKHRLYEALLSPTYQIQSKLRQSGGYDRNILCGDCDNKIIGNLERYASLVLFGGIDLSITQSSPESMSRYIEVKGIDYRNFKLFLLSILWRASISTLPIFQNVDLKERQEDLRERLQKNNPGASSEYQCAIFTYLHHSKITHQLIAEPKTVMNDEGQVCAYFFLIGGILFVFSSQPDVELAWIQSCTINEKGSMRVIQMSENLTANVINKITGLDLV
jgi:hypothetical protein